MSAHRLVYLHGFRSSPLSFKAQMVGERMRAAELPPSPRAAMRLVREDLALRPEDALVGSSLGGYYATWLAEQLGCRAVLLNPAVTPAEGLDRYTGPQTMYHSDEPFDFRPEYLDELRELRVRAITRPERYFLVAATGDELLDWRDMVAHYPGAKQRVIQGSDHGISDFDLYIDEVLAFAGVTV